MAAVTDPDTREPDPEDVGARTPPNPWLAALAGLVAAGMALATGEVLSGISGEIRSLVLAVGDVFVDNTPGTVVQGSIDTVGSAQKPALIWGITIGTLLAGALVGDLARRRLWIGGAAYAVFGVFGGWAAARDPIGSDALGWFAGLLSALVGFVTLVLLLEILKGGLHVRFAGASQTAAKDRRAFLWFTAGAAGLGLVGAAAGRALRNRLNVNAAREEVAAQLGASPGTALTPADIEVFDDIPGMTPMIVPNDEFYRIDTALFVPQIDPGDWSLKITGMVDNPFELTFDELLQWPMVENNVTLSCVSNEVGGNLVGNALWLGVPLRLILDEAGVQQGATQVVGRSVDDWTSGFPTELVYEDRPVMVAVAMNGEPLPADHGFPARLVVAGLYGYVSATKWLREVELTTLEEFDAYWIPRGWSKFGPIKTQSRIDVPRGGSTVSPGPTTIAGIAWAPTRAIERVEVQVDDEPWADAELSGDLAIESWRQWRYRWDATPGPHVLRVRATDGTGETQTSAVATPAPDGATGWHAVSVRVDEA